MNTPTALNAYGDAGGYAIVAAFFLGSASAVLLRAFMGRRGKARQDRYLSFSALLATPAVATFAMALISSNGPSLFLNSEFLLIVGGVVLLGAISCTFPRAIGFPVAILLGGAISMYSYLYLRFPEISAVPESVGTVALGPNGERAITLPSGVPFGGILYAPPEGDVVVRYVVFIFDRRIPFVGGQRRGAIAGIRTESSVPSEIMFRWAENHPLALPGVVAETHETALPAVGADGPHRYSLKIVGVSLAMEPGSLQPSAP